MPETHFPDITKTNKVPAGDIRDSEWLMAGHNRYQVAAYRGIIDGIRGPQWATAVVRTKELLGYPKDMQTPIFGNHLYRYLIGYDTLPVSYRERRKAVLAAIKKAKCYPLAKLGVLIGFPGIGTHSFYASPNNWQSDKAVDIRIPVYTDVVAYEDGIIDPHLGYGPTGEGGVFAGSRFHLRTTNNCFYYTHLTSISVAQGVKVKKGQRLGKSGSANGVPHLHWACQYGDPVTYLKNVKPCS